MTLTGVVSVTLLARLVLLVAVVGIVTMNSKGIGCALHYLPPTVVMSTWTLPPDERGILVGIHLHWPSFLSIIRFIAENNLKVLLEVVELVCARVAPLLLQAMHP